MKPKPLHILAALLFTAAASFGQLSSPWNFTQDVARAESQQQPMQWFAAETLELNLWSRRLSSAVDFSDPGLKLLWEVVAQTNVQTTWAATTGTVTAATNGAARYALNNQQANLPAGSYLGFVRAVWTNGTITSNVVLQYQAITVKASANSGLYPVADPITQAYGITGAVVSLGGSVTQSGRTLYFSTPGVFTSLVRGAGSSDRLTVTNGGGSQATINLNVSGLATDNQWRADTERVGLVASNALAGLPSLAALTQGVVNVGLVASNALAGLPSLAGLSNAVTAAALAATNADTKAGQAQVLGTNANSRAAQAQVLGTNAYAMASQAVTNYTESGTGNAITGLVKSAQTLTGYRGTIAGSGSGTITNILRGAGSSTRLSVSNGAGPQVTLSLDVSGLATSDQWRADTERVGLTATNAGNTAAQAQVLGTNAFTLAVTASNLAASAFAGLPSLAALSNNAAAWPAVSNLFRIGTNVLADQGSTNLLYNGVGLRDGVGAGVQYQDTRGFTNSGGVIVGTGLAAGPSLVVGNATSSPSCFAGGDGSQATGATSIAFGDRAKAFGVGAVAFGPGGPNAWGDGSVALGYGPDAYGFASIAMGENAEAGGVNSFALGGVSTNNQSYSIGYDATAGHAYSFAVGSGASTTTSNQFYAAFSGGYVFSGGAISGNGSGLTNLPASGGAPQSPITNTVDYAENVLTAAHLRVRSLMIGEGNSLGTGSNNVPLVGGTTFGTGTRGNVSAGQAATFGNSAQNSFVSGTNNTAQASYQSVGGRQNTASANYAGVVAGFGNMIVGVASFDGAGWYNTNSVGDYAVLPGGIYNRAQANYASVGGGATNWALAIGSTIAGGGGMTIASTGDWSIAYNAAPTNRLTYGVKQGAFFNVPGGFLIVAGGTTCLVTQTGISGATGTGSWSITESGLIVNGVAK